MVQVKIKKLNKKYTIEKMFFRSIFFLSPLTKLKTVFVLPVNQFLHKFYLIKMHFVLFLEHYGLKTCILDFLLLIRLHPTGDFQSRPKVCFFLFSSVNTLFVCSTFLYPKYPVASNLSISLRKDLAGYFLDIFPDYVSGKINNFYHLLLKHTALSTIYSV